MKIKHRVGDFRVTELLEDGVLQERGDHSVYRVTKRKLSTEEAARELAGLCGVERGDVGTAGLKDRQGITVQHMSVPARARVHLDRPDLRIEHVGFLDRELGSGDSRGNAFHVVVRALDRRELAVLRRNLPQVREHGLPDYFDDQRFGNLRHAQGWIARDLMLGRPEAALAALLCAPSPFDDERARAFKGALRRAWGDWRECRDAAGRFGAHHSVFEHLGRHPEDFAGAFYHVASRVRLIHLFAWQSHVWNRAVAALVRDSLAPEERVVVESLDGTLPCFAGEPPPALAERTFRLPGDGLEDVVREDERALLADVLAQEGLVPSQFRIEGVPGFQLKGEDRPLVVLPRHLRVRPAAPDPDHPGASMVALRFELPRGSYASLVVKRLFARTSVEREARRPGSATGSHADERAGDERRGAGPAGGRRERPRHSGAGGRGRRGRDDEGAGGARGDGRGREGGHRPWLERSRNSGEHERVRRWEGESGDSPGWGRDAELDRGRREREGGAPGFRGDRDGGRGPARPRRERGDRDRWHRPDAERGERREWGERGGGGRDERGSGERGRGDRGRPWSGGRRDGAGPWRPRREGHDGHRDDGRGERREGRRDDERRGGAPDGARFDRERGGRGRGDRQDGRRLDEGRGRDGGGGRRERGPGGGRDRDAGYGGRRDGGGSRSHEGGHRGGQGGGHRGGGHRGGRGARPWEQRGPRERDRRDERGDRSARAPSPDERGGHGSESTEAQR